MQGLARACLWIIRIGVFLALFTPLVVAQNLFFPFITGKAFFFRFIAEVVFASWVVLLCIKPEFRPQRSAITLSASAFLGIAAIASIFGADFYHSFWSNFERMEGLVTLLHVGMFFIVVAHVLKTKKEWAYYFSASLGISAIVAGYGFLQWRGVLQMIGDSRIYSTFGNSIYLAVYMMFHLFILSVFFEQAKSWSVRAVYAGLFLFEGSVFLLAASRGAFIGLASSIILFAFGLIFTSRNNWLRYISLATILLFVMLGVLIFRYPESTIVQKNEVFSRFSSLSLESVTNDARFLIWGIAWRAFQERPVLGWGLENFVIPYAKYYDPNLFGNEAWFDRAHNMLLEWLVATGILGFAAYLAIFISIGYVLARLVKRSTLDLFTAITIGGFFVAYLVQNIFVFDNIVTYILIVSVLAFVHSMSRERKSKNIGFSQGNVVIVTAIMIPTFIFIAYNSVLLPMLTAQQLITALNSLTGRKSVEDVISEFRKAIDYETFGATETRERVADTAVQIAINSAGTNKAFSQLLDFSIQEMENEIISHPQEPRPRVFLGKLYTIKHNISHNSFKEAESAYKNALAVAPNYITNYLGLAELYMIEGKKEQAVDAVRTAFSKPTKLSTLGALFYPVLSVHVLAGEFQEAITFMQEHRKRIGDVPFFGPTNEDVYLLIQRTGASSDSKGKLTFYEAWNRMFIDDFGFPQPAVLGELIRVYNALGENQDAREAIAKFANNNMKKLARAYTDDMLKNSASPDAARKLINKFLADLDALPSEASR